MEGVRFYRPTYCRRACWISEAGLKSLPTGQNETAVRLRRHELRIHPRYRMVDSCAAESRRCDSLLLLYLRRGRAESGVDYVPGLASSVKQRIAVVGSAQ